MRFLMLILLCVCGPGSVLAQRGQSPPIALELMAAPGFPTTGQQRWLRFLQEFGFSDIRIRGANAGDQPQVVNRGTDAAPRYRLTGILTGSAVMQLPGVVIRYGQRNELRQYLEKLRRGGTEAVTAATGVFGLTENQLVQVHDGLRPAVIGKTKGQATGSTVHRIAGTLKLPMRIDSAAERAMRSAESIRDELQGLSAGTALVAIIRPLGLDLVPSTHAGGKVQLQIVRSGAGPERWPLGWKPKQPPNQCAPKLFEFLPVEIEDTPLSEALAAIEARTNVRFLFDHNGLAKKEVDQSQKVSLPATKTFYKKIIDRLLSQARLRCELRTDEAGTPFLWVTTTGR